MSTKKKDDNLCIVKWCRNRRDRGRALCSKHAKQAWRQRHQLKARFAVVRDRAIRKGLCFELTLDDFVELEALCGGVITSRHHIDRISSAKGYTRDNVQVLSAADNTAKGNRERGAQLQLL